MLSFAYIQYLKPLKRAYITSIFRRNTETYFLLLEVDSCPDITILSYVPALSNSNKTSQSLLLSMEIDNACLSEKCCNS